jgi:hypothetical protein
MKVSTALLFAYVVINFFTCIYLLDGGNTGGAFGIPTFIRGLPRLFGVEAVARF